MREAPAFPGQQPPPRQSSQPRPSIHSQPAFPGIAPPHSPQYTNNYSPQAPSPQNYHCSSPQVSFLRMCVGRYRYQPVSPPRNSKYTLLYPQSTVLQTWNKKTEESRDGTLNCIFSFRRGFICQPRHIEYRTVEALPWPSDTLISRLDPVF